MNSWICSVNLKTSSSLVLFMVVSSKLIIFSQVFSPTLRRFRTAFLGRVMSAGFGTQGNLLNRQGKLRPGTCDD